MNLQIQMQTPSCTQQHTDFFIYKLIPLKIIPLEKLGINLYQHFGTKSTLNATKSKETGNLSKSHKLKISLLSPH